MAVDKIKCVYCGTENVISTKITSNKDTIKLKGLRSESSNTLSSPQMKIDCPLCGKKYACIIGAYPEYLKNHVDFAESALEDLKIIFPKLKKLESIFKNSKGIAKLDKHAQQLRSKDYDITFKISSKRAYLHCKKKGRGLLKKTKTLFIAVSVHEV